MKIREILQCNRFDEEITEPQTSAQPAQAAPTPSGQESMADAMKSSLMPVPAPGATTNLKYNTPVSILGKRG